jgi:hypothetical protein
LINCLAKMKEKLRFSQINESWQEFRYQ